MRDPGQKGVAPIDPPAGDVALWRYKVGYSLPSSNELEASTSPPPDDIGFIQISDWDTRRLLWRSNWARR